MKLIKNNVFYSNQLNFLAYVYECQINSISFINDKLQIINYLIFDLNILFKNDKIFLNNILNLFRFYKTISFVEFKIIGLGFKIKRGSINNKKILKFDIGFSHFYKLIIPENLRFVKGKKKFFLFSNNFCILNNSIKNIRNLKHINPYKIKGLKINKLTYRIKAGKRQNKR